MLPTAVRLKELTQKLMKLSYVGCHDRIYHVHCSLLACLEPGFIRCVVPRHRLRVSLLFLLVTCIRSEIELADRRVTDRAPLFSR